jgi:IclR family KDG regulon transcriptional repressor
VSNIDKNKSATALRAFLVLEAVAASSVPVSVNEVAEVVGADKTTVYRMLMTLIEAGYVIRDDLSKRYRLSYKVVSLSRNLLAEDKVSYLIHQTLQHLTDETRETMHYSVLDGGEAVLVQQVKGTQLVVVDYQIGDRAKLHCSAIGKVLLAFQDVRYIEQVIAAGLPIFTRNTITDPDAFRRELQRIRSQGYAIDDRELADNMRCLGVPVFEGGGRVHGGISLSGPDSRFTLEKLEELKEPLLKASRELSKQLGGLPWTT